MLAGEPGTGAAEAGDHLVGDQEHAVTFAETSPPAATWSATACPAGRRHRSRLRPFADGIGLGAEGSQVGPFSWVNTGARAPRVAQLYLGPPNGTVVPRPPRQLTGFAKVNLVCRLART